MPPSAYAAKASVAPASKNWTGIIMTALVGTSMVGGIAYSLGYGQGCNKSSDKDSEGSLESELGTEGRSPQQSSSMPLVPILSSDSIELNPQKHFDFSEAISTSALEANFSDTARLEKIDIVTELIQDLQSLDPSERRKAIWDLGQHGDSRAVLPMVDLMRDSDSGQRSLILAAVSEIGMKTLKPVNRALMLSLQDGSSDVRKNGIRDVTRLYDLVGQVSQLLQHAATDPDQEVQETATWALTQLNRIHPVSGVGDLPRLPTGLGLKELGTGKGVEKIGVAE
jgi:HEAT repeats